MEINKDEGRLRENSQKKWFHKIINKRAYVVRMFVGEDIRVAQIMEFVGITMVGHFPRRRISTFNLNGWIHKVWVLVLGYGSSFNIFYKG